MFVNHTSKILTTVTPKMMTKSKEASPITITAIAHWGSKTLSSAKPTVGCICFGNTEVENKLSNLY